MDHQEFPRISISLESKSMAEHFSQVRTQIDLLLIYHCYLSSICI